MFRPGARSLLVALLAVVAAVYLSALGWLKWNEIALVYRPLARVDAIPGDLGLQPERLRAAGDDGAMHLLWVYRTQIDRPAPWVIYLHGNAANISTSVNIARCHQLTLLGLNVVAVEYPGFGESPGVPGEPSMVAAATVAWRWLTRDIGVDSRDVALYGWSLGSGVATQLAADVDEGALVLEGAFTSVADRAGEVYPYVPVSWLLRHPFASRDRISAAGSPVLLLHARDDEIVPFVHGERLLALAAGLRQLVPLSGGHVYGNLVSEDDYMGALYTFLSDALDSPLTPPPRSLATALLKGLPTDAARREAGLSLAHDVLTGVTHGYNRASYGVEYAGRRWFEVDESAGLALLTLNADAQPTTASASRALGDALSRAGRAVDAQTAYARASAIR